MKKSERESESWNGINGSGWVWPSEKYIVEPMLAVAATTGRQSDVSNEENLCFRGGKIRIYDN